MTVTNTFELLSNHPGSSKLIGYDSQGCGIIKHIYTVELCAYARYCMATLVPRLPNQFDFRKEAEPGIYHHMTNVTLTLHEKSGGGWYLASCDNVNSTLAQRHEREVVNNRIGLPT